MSLRDAASIVQVWSKKTSWSLCCVGHSTGAQQFQTGGRREAAARRVQAVAAAPPLLSRQGLQRMLVLVVALLLQAPGPLSAKPHLQAGLSAKPHLQADLSATLHLQVGLPQQPLGQPWGPCRAPTPPEFAVRRVHMQRMHFTHSAIHSHGHNQPLRVESRPHHHPRHRRASATAIPGELAIRSHPPMLAARKPGRSHSRHQVRRLHQAHHRGLSHSGPRAQGIRVHRRAPLRRGHLRATGEPNGIPQCLDDNGQLQRDPPQKSGHHRRAGFP